MHGQRNIKPREELRKGMYKATKSEAFDFFYAPVEVMNQWCQFCM